MKYGCVFPTVEIGSDPVAIRDFVQTAEGLGYQHIITYDHVLGAVHADRDPRLWGPYTEADPFHEPMVLFGYMAAITSTIDLVTGVLISPQRQGVLVAKQAAELAVLSEGRFRLGVGTGWNHVEYTALGMPFDERGAMLDEQVALWRQLWTGEVVTFDGRFHTVDRASLLPVPPEPIPIWFGGSGPRALRRAARLGDGFIFAASADRAEATCTSLTDQLEANGRRDGFAIDALVGFGDGPGVWHDKVQAWEGLGADTLSIRTMTASSKLVGEADPGFTSPRQHIDALEIFMREVGD